MNWSRTVWALVVHRQTRRKWKQMVENKTKSLHSRNMCFGCSKGTKNKNFLRLLTQELPPAFCMAGSGGMYKGQSSNYQGQENLLKLFYIKMFLNFTWKKHKEYFKTVCWLLVHLPTFLNSISVWWPVKRYCARLLSRRKKRTPRGD